MCQLALVVDNGSRLGHTHKVPTRQDAPTVCGCHAYYESLVLPAYSLPSAPNLETFSAVSILDAVQI
jgi:hypothetical protein